MECGQRPSGVGLGARLPRLTRWPNKLSTGTWTVGMPGRPKWVAIACRVMTSLVKPELICAPLSDTTIGAVAIAGRDRRSRRVQVIGPSSAPPTLRGPGADRVAREAPIGLVLQPISI
jgi:hypothetical protein